MQNETAEHATLMSTLRATGLAAAFSTQDLPATRKLARRAERAQNDPVARIYFADAVLGQVMAVGESPPGNLFVSSAGSAGARDPR